MYYLKKIFRDVFASVILLISLTLTIFCSFNVARFIKAENEEKDVFKRAYKYSNVFSFSGTDLDYTYLYDSSLYNGLKCNASVFTNTYIDNGQRKTDAEILLYQNENIPYKLIEGSYQYNNDQLVVYIGKDLLKYTDYINGKRWLSIYGYKFMVQGIMDSSSILGGNDMTLFYYDNLCEFLVDDTMFKRLFIEKHFCIGSNLSSKDVEDIKEKIIKKTEESVDVEYVEDIGSDSFESETQKLFGNKISKITEIFCVLNVVMVISVWIKRKHKEIAIRKAVGESNFRILCKLFKQFSVIFVLAFIFGMIVQKIYSMANGMKFEISDYIYGDGRNIFIGIIVLMFLVVGIHITYISKIEIKNGLADK